MPDAPVATIGRRERSLLLPTRLASPGFLYNFGNLLGLLVGLGVGLARHAGRSGDTLAGYFAGDSSALWLTAATLVFLLSGAVYQHAWRVPGCARSQWVRSGDLLSGIGAILLGASLVLVGQPLLALLSATLNSVGKLGSALVGERSDEICRWFRWLVLGSRAFGLAASAAALLAAGSGSDVLMSATLFACYLIWAGADFLLLKFAD